ncbi:hypothetical protein O3M35_002707 [Rhynocoris fuscipes]|uniref:Suppressor of cytokine signaling 7 n=1 Tax=Rhynocoris fuscipes TaxID=488301 RepID=A0AAW1CS97_9HEMI
MMDSPPSCSAWNGVSHPGNRQLLIKSSSFSSGIEFIESEDEKSYCDQIEDSVCDETNFLSTEASWLADIAPPPEFQDIPQQPVTTHKYKKKKKSRSRRIWTPPISPGPSLSSLLRHSSSHNSLSVPANRVDDSSFITSAMSHDALQDLYNVPLDSDIYALPIDTVTSTRITNNNRRNRHHRQNGKKRRRQVDVRVTEVKVLERESKDKWCSKRRSAPPESAEPVHMTLQEVRQFLHTLYSGGASHHQNSNAEVRTTGGQTKRKHKKKNTTEDKTNNNNNKTSNNNNNNSNNSNKQSSNKNSISHMLKQTLCNMFRVRRPPTTVVNSDNNRDTVTVVEDNVVSMDKEADDRLLVLNVPPPFSERALPPVPDKSPIPTLIARHQDENAVDFAASIQKVKDYGWYWGPISGEAAEKVLSNEPDGSFIVRDSSDHHYIFSLTFRLNGCVRHVRIEHDQGNFSFGSCTKFKSQTIVEFIETAVEHSRSGRYLFFLHRRPVLGPMRVQLLHPVSRFKHVQSLQHLCRFAIVKVVRRDLIPSLPLPKRLIDYLSAPQYYSEQFSDQEQPSSPPSLHLFSFVPPN